MTNCMGWWSHKHISLAMPEMIESRTRSSRHKQNMICGVCPQFRALMWKHVQERKRQYPITLLELILPTIASLILLALSLEYPVFEDTNTYHISFKNYDPECMLYGSLTEIDPFDADGGFKTYVADELVAKNSIQPEGEQLEQDYEIKSYALQNNTCPQMNGMLQLAYTPPGGFARKLMEKMKELVGDPHRIDLIPLSKEEDVHKMSGMAYHHSSTNFLGLVSFSKCVANSSSTPPALTYTLRFPGYNHNLHVQHLSWYTRPNETTVKAGQYYLTSKFLAVQNAIDRAFIQMSCQDLCDSSMVGGFSARAIPFSKSRMLVLKDRRFVHLEYLSSNIMYSFLIHWVSLAYGLAREKELGLTDTLKKYGIHPLVQVISWMISALLTVVPAVCLSSSILTLTDVVDVLVHVKEAPLEMLSTSVLIVVLLCYSLSCLFLTLVITAICNTAFIAAIATAIIWVATWIFSSFWIGPNYYSMGAWTKYVLAAIHPNTGLSIACRIISLFYLEDRTLDWSTVDETPSFEIIDLPGKTDTINLLQVILVFAGQIVFYCIQVCVLAGFGTQKSHAISNLKTLVCVARKKSSTKVNPSTKGDEIGMYDQDSWPPSVGWGPFHEECAEWDGTFHISIPGVYVEDLTVELCGQKIVSDLNFVAKQGEVTVLLGPSGSGKTTVLNFLAGTNYAKSGLAYMIANDRQRELQKLPRHCFGYYIQEAKCFAEHITVEENLHFFAQMKGVPVADKKRVVNKCLRLFRLIKVRHVQPKELPHCILKKLSLCVAFLGEPQVILLDDPAAGLDDMSIKDLWASISDCIGSSTVLMATRNLQEALEIGDCIIAIDKGSVLCHGRTRYVKNHLGSGFLLQIKKDSLCEVKRISSIVKRYVPGSRRERSSQGMEREELYFLPECERLHFSRLFDLLQSESKMLGIAKLSLTKINLKDLFYEFIPEGRGLKMDESQYHKLLSQETALSAAYHGNTSNMRVCGILMKILLLICLHYKTIWRQIMFYTLQVVLLLAASRLAFATVQSAEPKNVILSYSPLKLSTDLIPSRALFQIVLSEDFPENISDYYITQMQEYGTSKMEAREIGNAQWRNFHNLSETDPDTYRQNCLGGIGLYKSTSGLLLSRIMYNPYYPQSSAVGFNILANVYLKQLAGIDAQITTYDHPLLDFSEIERMFFDAASFSMLSRTSVMASVVLALGMANMLSTFLVRPMKDRQSLANRVLHMAGACPALFWSTKLICDFVIWILIVAGVVGLVTLCDSERRFFSDKSIVAFAVVLLLSGASSLIFSYVFSFCRQNKDSSKWTALMFLTFFHSITGIMTAVGIHGLEEVASTSTFAQYIRWPFLILPYFLITQALIDFFTLLLHNARCSLIPKELLETACHYLPPTAGLPEKVTMNRTNYACCKPEIQTLMSHPYFTWTINLEKLYMWDSKSVRYAQIDTSYTGFQEVACHGLLEDMVVIAGQILAYFTLLILLEKGIQYRKWWNFKRQPLPLMGTRTLREYRKGVQEENHIVTELIRSQNLHQRALVVHGLYRTHGGEEMINNLTFSIRFGECLGICGHPGSGLITLVRLLTGQRKPSYGDAVLFGYSLNRQPKKFLSLMGLSSTEGGLIGDLTGLEMLHLVGQMRGAKRRQITAEVSKWAEALGMTKEQLAYRCDDLELPHRRFLSVMVAAVGSPPMLLLQGPTEGLESNARNRLWAVLRKFTPTFLASLLVTSSMEDCDQVCHRVGILSSGVLWCLLPTHKLDNISEPGFLINIQLQSACALSSSQDLHQLRQDFQRSFKPCTLLMENESQMNYHVNTVLLSSMQVVIKMEELRSRYVFLKSYNVRNFTPRELFTQEVEWSNK